jgi:hypothetical protein
VAGGEEIAWGIRRWFETLAERGPLVLVVDDIQWAEENLRALLADLPRLSARAPIMLVCLARTELLDEAPGWAPTIRLEALDESEGEALVREMLGGLAEPGLVQRVTAASGGNPLFAREIAAMLQEEDGLGSGKAAAVDVEIPPTLTMLLEARLDRLPERERAALERGSVEGEVFHRGAVVELSSSESRPSVRRDIEGLIRRGFLRHERAEFVTRRPSASSTCWSETRPTGGSRRRTAPSCTKTSRRGSKPRAQDGSSSTRRSSATTSSRPTDTGRPWVPLA